MKQVHKSVIALYAFSRLDMEKLLSDLYDRFENVRNFIDLRLSGNSEQLIKKYKKLIRKQLEEGLEEGTNGLQENCWRICWYRIWISWIAGRFVRYILFRREIKNEAID